MHIMYLDFCLHQGVRPGRTGVVKTFFFCLAGFSSFPSLLATKNGFFGFVLLYALIGDSRFQAFPGSSRRLWRIKRKASVVLQVLRSLFSLPFPLSTLESPLVMDFCIICGVVSCI
jgi:hypothetical protein